MRISIRWTDSEAQAVLAAIDEGAAPELAPDVAASIRAAPTARPTDAGPVVVLDLDFQDGQRLKAWCDARRERATEDEPNDLWTRIVARVNEAVQPFAPAKEPGGGAERPRPTT
ncbi:MAG TPA: hypothetical protein VGT40_26565 [Methylomirabilota bacterium]|jgi:hypothetical protein|nr:hypothetical protein [Methylomirabilota bacterium]